ncbi:hypothetical protein WDW86_10790 [Bdellovibrionota bacterium FG-2]
MFAVPRLFWIFACSLSLVRPGSSAIASEIKLQFLPKYSAAEVEVKQAIENCCGLMPEKWSDFSCPEAQKDVAVAACLSDLVHQSTGALDQNWKDFWASMPPAASRLLWGKCSGNSFDNMTCWNNIIAAKKLDPKLRAVLKQNPYFSKDAAVRHLNELMNSKAQHNAYSSYCGVASGGLRIDAARSSLTIANSKSMDPRCLEQPKYPDPLSIEFEPMRAVFGTQPFLNNPNGGPVTLNNAGEDVASQEGGLHTIGRRTKNPCENELKEFQRQFDSKEACNVIQNTAMIHFEPQVLARLLDLDANTYEDLLRIYSLSRLLAETRTLTGEDIDSSYLKSCGRYSRGIAKFLASPAEPTPDQSSEYQEEMFNAVPIVKELFAEHERISKTLRSGDWGDHEPTEEANQIQKQTQAESVPLPRAANTTECAGQCSSDAWVGYRKEIEQKINQVMTTFPYLFAGASAKGELFSAKHYPLLSQFESKATFKFALNTSKNIIARNLGQDAAQVCTRADPPEGLNLEQLLLIGPSRGAILNDFQALAPIDRCVRGQITNWNNLETLGHVALIGSCGVVGFIGGGPVGAMTGAGLCMGASDMRSAYFHYQSAKGALAWLHLCRAAGGAICSMESHQAALADLEQAKTEGLMAVGELVFAGVLSAAEAAPMIRSIAVGAKHLKPSQIKQVTRQLKLFTGGVRNRAATTADLLLTDLKELHKFTDTAAHLEEAEQIITEMRGGARMVNGEKLALEEAQAISSAETASADEIATQNHILLRKGFKHPEIDRMRSVGVLPKARVNPATIESVPSFRLKMKPIDKSALKEIRNGKKYYYVIDDNDQILLVSRQGELGSKQPALWLAEDLEGGETRLIRETGTIDYDPVTRQTTTKPLTATELSEEENQALRKNLTKKDSKLKLSNTVRKDWSQAKVFECLDILAAQSSGKNFIASEFTSNMTYNIASIGFGELAGAGRLNDPKKTEMVKSDLSFTALATAPNALVRRNLVFNPNGFIQTFLGKAGLHPYLKDMVVRGGLGISIGQGKKAWDGLVLEHDGEKRASSVMWFNLKHLLVRLPINKEIDRQMFDSIPRMAFNACQKGSPLKILVYPWAVRIYERTASDFVYLEWRRRSIGE